jgi:hypothetical protein
MVRQSCECREDAESAAPPSPAGSGRISLAALETGSLTPYSGLPVVLIGSPHPSRHTSTGYGSPGGRRSHSLGTDRTGTRMAVLRHTIRVKRGRQLKYNRPPPYPETGLGDKRGHPIGVCPLLSPHSPGTERDKCPLLSPLSPIKSATYQPDPAVEAGDPHFCLQSF